MKQVYTLKLKGWSLFGLLLVLMAAVVACGGSQGAEPAAVPPASEGAPAEETAVPTETVPDAEPAVDWLEQLANTDWDLVSYGGQTPLPDTNITITFQPDSIGGSAGCNSYFLGTYTLEDSNFTVGEVGSTMMFCEASMDQEQAYLAMLQAATSLNLVGDVLTIGTAEGDLIFQPAQHAELLGTNWVLNGIAQPETEAVVSTQFDQNITAVFADGQMTGYTGCNQYFGAYETAEDGSLTLSGIGATKRACMDDGTGQRESEFLKALADVASYTIQRDVLTLWNKDGAMVMAFLVTTAAE